MRKTALILAAAAAVLSGPALQAKPRETGEEKLAMALAEREGVQLASLDVDAA